MQSPEIDERDVNQMICSIERSVPFYTPEWRFLKGEGDTGSALVRIFALMFQGTINRLNGVPDKNFIAFLNMLGLSLLPAQQARVPLVFKLSNGASENVILEEGIQAAANPPQGGDPIIFQTEKTIAATPAGIKAVVSTVPASSLIADHTGDFENGLEFRLFQQVENDDNEHSIYLGNSKLFRLKGAAGITIFSPELANPHVISNISWEWRNKDHWEASVLNETFLYRFEGRIGEEGNLLSPPENLLRVEKKIGNGNVVEGITLKKLFEHAAFESVSVNGIENYWIRGRIHESALKFTTELQKLTLGNIRVAVSNKDYGKLNPDSLFYNDVPLDPSGTESIYPFGTKPRAYDTFYIASSEAFTKAGARIEIAFDMETELSLHDVLLSWEYWDGNGWRVIKSLPDELSLGMAKFKCPEDMEATSVNGEENYWIRIRIVSVDHEEGVASPKVKSIKIIYTMDDSIGIERCITSNNLNYEDRTREAGDDKVRFKPFSKGEETNGSLYIGFDIPPLGGPIRIYFSLEPQEYYQKGLPLIRWEYYSQAGWEPLSADDGTGGLTHSGMLEFYGPPDFAILKNFGRNLFWIHVVDINNYFEDSSNTPAPKIRGIFMNSVWASQGEKILEEVLGSSDGTSGQQFKLVKVPVQSEDIWVNEIGELTEGERRILEEEKKFAIQKKYDDAGNAKEFWVKWEPVDDLAESTAGSRHYEMDRTFGFIQFGDGKRGKIPPAGKGNIKADYSTGGSAGGNVGEMTVKTLRTSVPFVDGVFNPEAASGGFDTEVMGELERRGPQIIKHQNRAVTEEDFEWLVRQASRGIARVKCLPDMNNREEFESGWVTVVIVPSSGEPRPIPSLELKRRVQQYLEENAANVVSFPRHISVVGPYYVKVTVNAAILCDSLQTVAAVEKAVLERVTSFLHPLTGGYEGGGWEFGRLPHFSDFFPILEEIKDVDHVEELSLVISDENQAKDIHITSELFFSLENSWLKPHMLLYGDKHNITVKPAVIDSIKDEASTSREVRIRC